MRPRKKPRSHGVVNRNCESLETLLKQNTFQICDQIHRHGKLSQPYFRRDLPCGCSADEDGILPPRYESPGASRERAIIRQPPQQSVSIQQQSQSELLPTIEFFRRKGVEKFGAQLKLSAQRARLTHSFAVLKRDESHYGIGTPSDDDLLAAASFLDQPREVGLGFVNGDSSHIY